MPPAGLETAAAAIQVQGARYPEHLERKTNLNPGGSRLPCCSPAGPTTAPARAGPGGLIRYLTEHGGRVAALVPAAVAAELERLSPGELAELLEDFADAAAAREARVSI